MTSPELKTKEFSRDRFPVRRAEMMAASAVVFLTSHVYPAPELSTEQPRRSPVPGASGSG
ncbi:MAG TPA: hypothetical protein VGF94_03785 [Kofleriaceae bacterium]|jgi:hypothetical protein